MQHLLPALPDHEHVSILRRRQRPRYQDLEERAAEIRKLEKEELAAAKKEAAKARLAEERACQSLQELQALGVRRGYAPGWAFKRWKTMGGRPKPAAPAIGLDGWPA